MKEVSKKMHRVLVVLCLLLAALFLLPGTVFAGYGGDDRRFIRLGLSGIILQRNL